MTIRAGFVRAKWLALAKCVSSSPLMLNPFRYFKTSPEIIRLAGRPGTQTARKPHPLPGSTLSKVVFRHMIQADLCEVAPKFYYLGSWHADLLYIDRRKCVLSLLKHQAQIILTKISANTYFAECWCCSRIIV
jgi:hypothetical protein